MASCQKLGIILGNEVIEKLILSKNGNNKNLVFLNEKKKKNEKDSDDFRHIKLTLKVKFGPF